MFLLDTFRIIKFAVQNFFRNIWLSVVTVVIIVLSLVSISVLLISNILTQHVLAVVQDKTEVYIDLTTEATADQAKSLVDELKNHPYVSQAEFITPEQTLQNFKDSHKDTPTIIESLNALDKNPFTGSIKIKVHNINDFPFILNELSKKDYAKFLEINDKEFMQSKLFIENVGKYSQKIGKAWMFISIFFILISILVVYNTLQIKIYTHREEIGIMKLVGASNSFVRSPFLIEGILYSLTSLIILLVILYPLLMLVQPYLDNFFSTEYSLNLVTALNQNFLKIFGTELLVSVIITFFSSFLAIRKYLHV
jgi:cell division transport system permease protein